ncbi:unnamed protein product [Blepharisma stoltei]|uniref:Uncharacterized protein n=1 Tax=Blepharisma stoltei TaxID=1481888 RepID=A0AAU9JPT4_9CILI|nr:unnamed protein product [Blepharisma stoltei]
MPKPHFCPTSHDKENNRAREEPLQYLKNFSDEGNKNIKAWVPTRYLNAAKATEAFSLWVNIRYTRLFCYYAKV